MDPKDKKLAQQEKEIERLTKTLAKLQAAVSILSRENNRRKAEITQITSVLRKA